MNLKGVVSLKENNLYKVFFKDKNFVSPHLLACSHVGELQVGDEVVVAFYNNNLGDGAIMGRL
jgi:hypothetical protein